jgi:hypothetical protein
MPGITDPKTSDISREPSTSHEGAGLTRGCARFQASSVLSQNIWMLRRRVSRPPHVMSKTLITRQWRVNHNQQDNISQRDAPSVPPRILSLLRSATPVHALTRAEMMSVCERQAERLLHLRTVTGPPVPDDTIRALPRIHVHEMAMGVSGMTQWEHGRWLMLIRSRDTHTRRRFTLAHEFKHILDHPYISVLYPDARGAPSGHRAEEACNYFAASLLMPRKWVRDAWHHGPQDIGHLAKTFDVSCAAMSLRLSQVGLADTTSEDSKRKPSRS